MIEWSKVDELREEIGDEDFSEIVDLFLEEVDEAMRQLRAGLSEDKLECCLHFLKGSALNLGFGTFSRLCADGETEAAAGRGAGVNIAKVVECYDASKAEFLDGLVLRGAA